MYNLSMLLHPFSNEWGWGTAPNPPQLCILRKGALESGLLINLNSERNRNQ